MTIIIQTAGTKSHRRRSVRGPDPPKNAVIVNAKTLKNPYDKLHDDKYRIGPNDREVDVVKRILQDTQPKKLDELVQKGVDAIRNGQHVVVVCLYGKHRSVAVAELIGKNFPRSRVVYHHREYRGP